MKTVVTAQVGENGVLNLSVPLGKSDALKTVRITVETIETSIPATMMDRAAWLRFIEKTAGSISDPTFKRHPQGDIEEREALP